MKRDIPRSTLIVVIIGAVIFGVLGVLLGTVTHAGGIDGGYLGLVLSLATTLLGAVMFYLFGGYLGWAVFAATTVVTMVLTLQIIGAGHDMLITGGTASTLWLVGTPATLFIGVAVGILMTGILIKQRSQSTKADSIRYRGDEAFKGDR